MKRWCAGIAALMVLCLMWVGVAAAQVPGDTAPFPAQAKAAPNTWTAAASLAVMRRDHTATLLPSGKILVVGGCCLGGAVDRVQLYDPQSNSWSAESSSGVARYGHTATLLPSGKVLVVGGNNGNNGTLASAQLYDPASNSWSTAASLAQARENHTATLLPSGKVLVVAGYDRGSFFVDSAEVYDPSSNIWSEAGSLDELHDSHSATLLRSGKVLVAGGSSSGIARLYDPASNSWSNAGTLGTARAKHTATLLPSGKVLIAGGRDIDATTTYASAELYDPVSNSWSAAASLAAARYSHTATLLPSGRVLVVGGGGVPTILASVELYDPASNSWSAAGSLSWARLDHTATLLHSGRVLVVGGYGDNPNSPFQSTLATAEVYEPASSTWSVTGSLATARQHHTATSLPSGQVLVVGGYNGAYLASAQLHDPLTNSWSAASSLTTARARHTATLLASGKVLVVGGFNGTYLTSAQLYDPLDNSWSSAGNLATARHGHTATLLPSGKVLVVGGFNGAYLASAEIYDPTNNSWSAAGNIATARFDHTATLMASGKVLVVGGYNGADLASPQIYDPASNSWSAASGTSTVRRNHTATLLPTGQVLVVGGAGSGGALATAQLYNPANNSWSAVGNLATGRFKHTATLLPSGQVLVVGGYNGIYRTSAEIYDPLDNSWSAAGNLATAREDHTATLLPSGQVLVVAGFNGSGSLASAERYTRNLGINDARRPQISSATSPIAAGASLQLTGSRFTGDSEASGGGALSSATNVPLLQLRRIDNEQIVWTAPATASTRSDTSYTSAPLPATLPLGPYAATVFVNAIPSMTTMIRIATTRTLTYSAAANGTISGASPQTVLEGESGTPVTAVANTGYHFVQWSDGSTANPRTDTNVTANISVTASFAINTYTLAYGAGANGSLTGATSQTVNHGASGTLVTAVANTGYHFVQWSDGSTANPRTDTNVTANISVTASFAINTYTLAYGAGANGSLTGATSQTVNHGASGTPVTAVANTGYHFVQWSDGSTANPRTDTQVIADVTVQAQFALTTYTVTATAAGNGAITPATQTVDHGGAANFAVNPDPDHVATLTGDTCTPADLGGGVWIAANITSACAVVASFTPSDQAAITVHSGDAQTATVLEAFADALVVRVVDAADAPSQGVTVTFTAPVAGASAVLSSASAVTDANGLASITASANALAGAYVVQATVEGIVTPANFALQNKGPLFSDGFEWPAVSAASSKSAPKEPIGLAGCEVSCEAAHLLPTEREIVASHWRDGQLASAHGDTDGKIGTAGSSAVMVPASSPWALILMVLSLFVVVYKSRGTMSRSVQ